jgi:hypothetical protein
MVVSYMKQLIFFADLTLFIIRWRNACRPGGLGKMSQFSCFYANLITQGKERGFHVFIVQLRDENHKPMPGVEVGEVGPKIGDNGTSMSSSSDFKCFQTNDMD